MSQDENGKKLPYTIIKDNHGREKIHGMWNNSGKKMPVTFSRHYGNHCFVDDEIQSLLKNETVHIADFKPKTGTGNILELTGKLGYQYYMGKAFIGFSIADVETPITRRLPNVPMQNSDVDNEPDY